MRVNQDLCDESEAEGMEVRGSKSHRMSIRGLLIDLDGVMYTGDHRIEGAAEALEWLREKKIPHLFLSNSTRRSRASIAERLSSMGLPIAKEEILTPAAVAAEELRRKGVRKCHLLVTDDASRDFRDAGILHEDEGAEAVVVGDAGENFTYGNLVKAFRALLNGGELVALEKDRYWMGGDGPMLSAGPFVAALEYASGIKASLIGKPSRAYFLRALHILGIPPANSAMIGDDIVTDVGGAKACGMMGILVKTGKFKPSNLENAEIAPDLVIDSIASLPVIL